MSDLYLTLSILYGWQYTLDATLVFDDGDMSSDPNRPHVLVVVKYVTLDFHLNFTLDFSQPFFQFFFTLMCHYWSAAATQFVLNFHLTQRQCVTTVVLNHYKYNTQVTTNKQTAVKNTEHDNIYRQPKKI